MVNKIAQLCKEKGLSFAELERRSGINEKSIWRWDKNTPSVDKVQKVANYLGITVEELLKNDEGSNET